jgi:uncharacterized protein YyaL (SSP411 family)
MITGEAEFERVAVAGLQSTREMMARFPAGAGHWLCALDFHLSSARFVYILGIRPTHPP